MVNEVALRGQIEHWIEAWSKHLAYDQERGYAKGAQEAATFIAAYGNVLSEMDRQEYIQAKTSQR